MFKFSNEIYRFLIISVILIGYFLTINIVGDKLDIYGTVIYYIDWIENIASIDGNFFSGILQSYVYTNSNLSAPEPLPGVLVFLITRIVKDASLVIDILNVSVLILMVTIFTKDNKKPFLFVSLFVVALITGYYEYVLLHMTHRLKVSFLFFLLSIFFVPKHAKVASTFYTFSLFSHLSMLTTIPIIFFLKRLGFKYLPDFSFKQTFFLLIFLAVIYLFNIETFNVDLIKLLWGNKFSGLQLDRQLLYDYLIYVPIILLAIYLIFKLYMYFESKIKRNKPQLFWTILLFIYFLGTFVVVGTSRLLMLYYLIFFILIIKNYNVFEIRKRRIVLLYFAPVFFYSLINGFLKGPISFF